MKLDDQIKQKEEELEKLKEIKDSQGKTLQSRVSLLVAEIIQETNRFIVVHNSTYWDTQGVKIYFNTPTATWNLAEKIIKAGLHISQIMNARDTMSWIVTETEKPEE